MANSITGIRIAKWMEYHLATCERQDLRQQLDGVL